MVLLFEDNLMWSARLVKSLNSLGHPNKVVSETPQEMSGVDVAIVNLGVEAFRDLVPDLVSRGVTVIGHAGHKEKELHELGRQVGCQILATNSELTFKLEDLVRRARIT